MEDVIREEEGTIMDCDITLLAGASLVLVGDGIPDIISPVMDWLMLGGRSPTPFILELSPGNNDTVEEG